MTPFDSSSMAPRSTWTKSIPRSPSLSIYEEPASQGPSWVALKEDVVHAQSYVKHEELKGDVALTLLAPQVVSQINPTTGKLYHASVNACLAPLVSVDGKHVITVEVRCIPDPNSDFTLTICRELEIQRNLTLLSKG